MFKLDSLKLDFFKLDYKQAPAVLEYMNSFNMSYSSGAFVSCLLLDVTHQDPEKILQEKDKLARDKSNKSFDNRPSDNMRCIINETTKTFKENREFYEPILRKKTGFSTEQVDNMLTLIEWIPLGGMDKKNIFRGTADILGSVIPMGHRNASRQHLAALDEMKKRLPTRDI